MFSTAKLPLLNSKISPNGTLVTVLFLKVFPDEKSIRKPYPRLKASVWLDAKFESKMLPVLDPTTNPARLLTEVLPLTRLSDVPVIHTPYWKLSEARVLRMVFPDPPVT